MDDTIYIGNEDGIAQYDTFTDGTGSYQLSYFSHPLAFGDSSVLKFLKKVNLTTFDGAEATVVLNWAYDYSNAYKSRHTRYRLITQLNTTYLNLTLPLSIQDL